VLTVTVMVVPEVEEAGAKLAEIPAGQLAPIENVTVPLNPFTGATATVELPTTTAFAVALVAERENVDRGGWLTVRVNVVDAFKGPLTPDTVMTEDPTLAVGRARINRIDDDVTGFAENEAEMPVGKPVAASVTDELKPLVGKMKIADDAPPPCVIPALEALRVKAEPALTVKASEVVTVCDPPVPVMVSE
jgi:hypothetical protein